MGHIITSQWIDEPESEQATWEYVRGVRSETILKRDELMEEKLAAIAARDFADIEAADILIRFPAHSPEHKSSGGKFIEMGIALGLDKEVVVVGVEESVFDYGDNVAVYNTFHHLLADIRPGVQVLCAGILPAGTEYSGGTV
jgi:hypothetical protein